MPLEHQLTDRNGVLIEHAKTTREYRLLALAGQTPPKPGLVHAPVAHRRTT
ncbi:MAG: allophanate hydrolase-related protein [Cognatishimia sp.]